MKRIGLLIAGLAVIALLAVGGYWATASQTTNLSDPNRPIEVATGKGFELKLESNPNSGYRWDVAKPIDEKVLGLTDFAYDAPRPMAGSNANGKEEWEFKALSPGTTQIVMKYVRPASGEVAKSVTFNVLVR